MSINEDRLTITDILQEAAHLIRQLKWTGGEFASEWKKEQATIVLNLIEVAIHYTEGKGL